MIETRQVVIFTKWFHCPLCGGRNIIWSQRTGQYTCRKCGSRFVADHKARRTYRVVEEVK